MVTNCSFKENWNKDDGIKYLYHFTSLDSLIKILLTDKFRLSSVDYMNDINESLPLYESVEVSAENVEKEKKIRRRTFLGCFNVLEENENIRDKSSLWGYYAQSCTGVCLKINKAKFDALLLKVIYDFENDVSESNVHIERFKIKYEKESDIYKHRKICANDVGLDFYTYLKYLYDKKSNEWKVENEFRYLVYNADYQDEEYYYIDNFSDAIEDIYIGKNNTDLKLLRDLKLKLTKNINFYVMNREREEMELDKF